jgi:Protein of unknown function (DUF3592)
MQTHPAVLRLHLGATSSKFAKSAAGNEQGKWGGRVMERQTIWPAVVFAIFWLAVVGYMSSDAVSDIHAQRRANQSFVPVAATVMSASVEEFRFTSNPGRRRAATSYSPAIIYEYEVAGTQYRGATYRFARESLSRTAAQTIVDSLPSGSRFTAYCDPDQPLNAVADRGAPSYGAAFLLILLGFGAGLLILVFGIRGTVPNQS